MHFWFINIRQTVQLEQIIFYVLNYKWVYFLITFFTSSLICFLTFLTSFYVKNQQVIN
jgi:uncharacterized membrane protein YjjP (DUF1212 family)